MRCRILSMMQVQKVTTQRLLIGLLLLLFLFIYCEFFIYYVVLLRCSWPSLDPRNEDLTIPLIGKPVRAMFLADTHLLGTREGHWFDKLRREWQMQRSFQSVLAVHSPDVVFLLGDLFDEGKWSSDAEFNKYLSNFQRMFSHSSKTQLQVVVGNHDIGFHYMIDINKRRRFSSAFDAPSVRMLTIRDSVFVLLNSMAFEGDNCDMCQEAEQQLAIIVNKLNCAKGDGYDCDKIQKFKYSRPVLLQHFPLFRTSDSNCSGADAAPEDIIHKRFRQKYDCLSQAATDKLLSELNPRLVVDGHTHHGCHTIHRGKIPEWTIASFNWRNKINPTFALAVISSNNFSLSTCFLPNENTVIFTYVIGGVALLVWLIYPQLSILIGRTRTRKSL